MKRVWLSAAVVLAMAACEDFDKDLTQYCAVKGCSGDSGTGGNGGGSTGGSGGNGGGGGGSGACHDFGATCSADSDCCTTTLVSGKAYPLACSSINYCQMVAPDCRPGKWACSSNSQCCSNNCSGGRCVVCAQDGEACTKAHDCCYGEICGTDGKCHNSYVGNSSAPTSGQCVASAFCVGGYCALDGGSEGNCGSTAACTGVEGSAPPTAMKPCCPGLQSGTCSGTACCCQADGTWCEYSEDCCGGDCTGGRCRSTPTGFGDRCDYGADCASTSTPVCDPIGRVCTDRWCSAALADPYRGCCIISGDVCTFPDAGSCLIGGATASSAMLCCSGILQMGTQYCQDPQLSN
jgi:hypothetical protein